MGWRISAVDGKPVTNDAELKSALALVREHDVGKQFDMTIVAPDTSKAEAAEATAATTQQKETVPIADAPGTVDDMPVTIETKSAATKASTTKSGYRSGMYAGRFESIADLEQT